MFYVYLLLDKKTNKTYIGFSRNLKQRIANHKSGIACKTTKNGDWHLVYYEAFSAKKDAQEREQKLKHHGMSERKLLERLGRTLAG